MSRANWKDRIVSDPEIHHGEPCIRGTRIPVRIIVGSLADGDPATRLIEQYPQLTLEDVAAALAYAAEMLHQESLLPLAS